MITYLRILLYASILLAMIGIACSSEIVSDDLLDAIAMVESNNDSDAIGDGGKSVGAYQLQEIYVDDVNRFLPKNSPKYTYEDRKDNIKSREMVRVYLTHYAMVYAMSHNGLPPTDEILARMHNGGPKGYLKQSTVPYWNLIKKVKR